MQTISFRDLEKRFQSVAGLATLDATDKFFFFNSLNSRIRDAWDRLDWPELIEIKELPVSTTDQGERSTGVVDYDVLDAWDKHPYKDKTAVKVSYTIIGSEIVLKPSFTNSSLFVLAKKKIEEYNESSTDIPKFLENFLIFAVLSDFYRGDGQSESASREESRSEEFLLRQIDRVEKLQQQNKPTLATYPVNDQIGSLYQN